jgi:hypothetical protein
MFMVIKGSEISVNVSQQALSDSISEGWNNNQILREAQLSVSDANLQNDRDGLLKGRGI